LDRCRIARRENLDAVEATPDGRLVPSPAAPLCLVQGPLDPARLPLTMALTWRRESDLMLGEHSWRLRLVDVATHRVVLNLDQIEGCLSKETVQEALHFWFPELKGT